MKKYYKNRAYNKNIIGLIKSGLDFHSYDNEALIKLICTDEYYLKSKISDEYKMIL